MPYITPEQRGDLFTRPAQNAGELNYSLTVFMRRYVVTKGLSYQTINDVLGALEGAKAEFYRRVAVPYENTKLTINGDVYDIQLT